MPANTPSIKPIKAFNDNYIWAIIEPLTGQVIVVDPGQAEPVIEFLQDHNYQLTAIWITHKHFDHVGGVQALQDAYPDVQVVAHANHGVAQTDAVSEGSEFVAFNLPVPVSVPVPISVKVWQVAGHTEHHLAYLLRVAGENQNTQLHVFCGDTLFSGGCGRVFTGDMSAMYNSLQRLKNLDSSNIDGGLLIADKDIFFYPAHEYTASNLKFGLHIEADNEAMSKHLAKVQRLNEQGQASLPSSLALEKQMNVFLRTDKASVVESVLEKADNSANHEQARNKQATSHTEEHIFAMLRQLKDDF